MKILHISDIHFGVPCFKPKKLLSKRFVGMLNYLFNRRRIYQYESLKKLGPSIEKRHIDYIIFTGDFATTSLEEEFVFGKNFLNSLEKYVRKIFIVPGNHDLYIRETAKEKLFERFFSDYLGEPLTKGALFPYSKEIDGEIVIVGVNSAMPMPFYSSEGFVSLDTI
ncbi:MAG: metallophosphoesterase, partial [Elusimicrobiota bacterium]